MARKIYVFSNQFLFLIVKIVVGNKTDLQQPNQLTVAEVEEIESYAKSIEAPLRFTSCKTGEGVVVI